MSNGEKQLQREGKRHSMRESRSFTGLKSPSGWCLQDSHPRKIRVYRVLGVSTRQVEWTAVIGAGAWTLMSREQSANKSYIKMVSHASILCVSVCVCVCVCVCGSGGRGLVSKNQEKKKEKHIFQKCSFPWASCSQNVHQPGLPLTCPPATLPSPIMITNLYTSHWCSV